MLDILSVFSVGVFITEDLDEFVAVKTIAHCTQTQSGTGFTHKETSPWFSVHIMQETQRIQKNITTEGDSNKYK